MRRLKKQAVQRNRKRRPQQGQDDLESKPIGKTDGARGSQQRGAGMRRGRGAD